MAGDNGAENSSEGGSQPLETAVAGSPAPVFVSYASHDAPLAQKVCAALEGDAGCLSDEIGNLVGPAERPHKEVRAGLTSHGWRDARRPCISYLCHA
jgi:hypothetical protein